MADETIQDAEVLSGDQSVTPSEQALTVGARGGALNASSAPSNNIHPLMLIDRAIEKGLDVEQLDKLMDLQERHEQSRARQAFNQAFAAARSEFKPIKRDGHVSYDHKSTDGKTSFRHETLAGIAAHVDPICAQ